MKSREKRPMAVPISRKGDSLKRTLFLCEDNHLASRFCEELFNSLVRDEGLNWQAVSRALSPQAARRCREPMSPAAVDRLRSLGAAPMNHRRLPLGATAFDFEMSHTIVAIVGREQQAMLRSAWPGFAPQIAIWLLDPLQPVGGRLTGLAEAVRRCLDRMLGRQPSARSAPARAGAARASAKLGLVSGNDPVSGYVQGNQQATGQRRREDPHAG